MIKLLLMMPHQNPHFTKLTQLALCSLALFTLAFCACPAQAQPRNFATGQPLECDPYNNLETARLATLQGPESYHLLKGNIHADCPSDKQACSTSMLVHPKQQLLIFRSYKQYSCVLSINPELSGWLPTNRLVISSVPLKRITNSQWQGWWRDPSQLRSIEIKPEKNGKLSVIAEGTYQGHYFDSQGMTHAEPYHRDFGFTAQMNTNPFNYQSQPYPSSLKEVTQEARYIEFFLIGNYLIVNERLNLGGNVNFSTIYQKYPQSTTNKKTRR